MNKLSINFCNQIASRFVSILRRADFSDGSGYKNALCFRVVGNRGSFEVFEAIVHKVDGNKRKYDLEN